MTDAERWIQNDQKLRSADPSCRRELEDVVKSMETRGHKPIVMEVRRSRLRQAWLFARKRTWTMNSKHLAGKAMDLIDVNHSWERTPPEFMADLAIVAGTYGFETGLVWGFGVRERWDMESAMRRGNRQELLSFIHRYGYGKDPCHVEKP